MLDGVDVDIESGEMVALLGRSGSGKSTLLNLLGGIDRPDAGTVEVAGMRVHDLTERQLTHFRRRHVGFVFQFFHLIPELTGEENVLMPARLTGGGSVERGRELLGRLGLNGAAEQLPHTLSGGEQQRIAIARAPVNEPDLILDRAGGGRPVPAYEVQVAGRVHARGRSWVDQGGGPFPAARGGP